jgi:diguanylate cyclase (GGDEF)-like protein
MAANEEAQTAAHIKVMSLSEALRHTEQVKDKVQECADGLSSINEVLVRHGVTEHLPVDALGKAVSESIEIEGKVHECAEDLCVLNRTLSDEIGEREDLERNLMQHQAELTAVRAHAEEAQHLALHDPLTGLPNRRLFNDRLNLAVAQAARHQRRLVVMFIDLDKFKTINDAYGHDVGDQVLKITAARLRASVRQEDTVARQGGDEFLYLMLDAGGDESIARAASKLLDNAAQYAEVAGKRMSVKASIGIARYPEDGTSPEALLKNADSAMYEAKRSGQGFVLYAELCGR